MEKNKPEEKETKPSEQSSFPEGLHTKNVKTVRSKLSSLIKSTLKKAEEMATMEHLMPIEARIRNRLEEIKKLSQAKHMKVKGHWKTFPPKMHIVGLGGLKTSNDTGEIKYSVYEMDENGNKKLHVKKAVVTMPDGGKVEREINAEYRIGHDVIETFKSGKPIEIEIIELDGGN